MLFNSGLIKRWYFCRQWFNEPLAYAKFCFYSKAYNSEFNYSCLFDEFLILAIVNLSAWFELEILTELTYCNDHFPAVCQTALDKSGKKVGTSKANTRSINGSCWLFIETLSVLKKINGSISKTSVVYYSQKVGKSMEHDLLGRSSSRVPGAEEHLKW